MSYAIRKDGQGWRAVNGPDDVMDSEVFSETPPTLVSSPAQILSAYTAAIQGRLDAFAQSRGYDSGVSCASYAASTNATFTAEAGRFVELRDNTWAACYAIMADVKAGKSPMPTLDDLLLELPVLTWDANG